MTKHTHFVLTCTKNHVWHEPIPVLKEGQKMAVGEHRLCPTCGGSSWIAPDAPRINKNVEAPKAVAPSPAAKAQTKVIPVAADLIPSRKLLTEKVVKNEQSEKTDTSEE